MSSKLDMLKIPPRTNCSRCEVRERDVAVRRVADITASHDLSTHVEITASLPRRNSLQRWRVLSRNEPLDDRQMTVASQRDVAVTPVHLGDGLDDVVTILSLLSPHDRDVAFGSTGTSSIDTDHGVVPSTPLGGVHTCARRRALVVESSCEYVNPVVRLTFELFESRNVFSSHPTLVRSHRQPSETESSAGCEVEFPCATLSSGHDSHQHSAVLFTKRRVRQDGGNFALGMSGSINVDVQLDAISHDHLDIVIDGEIAIDLTETERLVALFVVGLVARVVAYPAVTADGRWVDGSVSDVSWRRHGKR
jgi:hypothetical protein